MKEPIDVFPTSLGTATQTGPKDGQKMGNDWNYQFQTFASRFEIEPKTV